MENEKESSTQPKPSLSAVAAFRNRTATFPAGWRAWENYGQGFYLPQADEKALCLHLGNHFT